MDANRTLAALTTSDLLDVGPIYAVSALPTALAGTIQGPRAPLATEERWPEVATLSSANGVDTTFTFASSSSRETKTQIAISVGGNPFEAGGFQLEADGRTGTAGPVSRSDMNYQYNWEASYQFNKYANCPHGICTSTWWEPDHWTGGVRHADEVNRPAFDRANSRRLNTTHSRDVIQTKTYGNSFSLAGVSLDSIASYATHTKMSWRPLGGTPACGSGNDSYIFGNGTDWPSAPIVWAICT